MRRALYSSGLLLAAAIWATGFASGGEIGFLEDFALARDRAAVLKQLIPGSEDYYYFHCLHYQNTEQYNKVTEMLPAWIQRHGHTARVREIMHRQALLTYEKNPEESLEYIRRTLGLQFNHERQLPGAKADLPTKLDPNAISRDTLLARELAQHGQLEGVEDSALDWLIGTDLSPERRRNLLSRLARPDYPNLVKLIVADLKHPNSGGFGSFNIHRQLLLSQLEELAKLQPNLLNETNFVHAYIAKLHPTPDEDWRHDRDVLEKYLDRLQAFVDRLAPVHNSLKAHVLYQRLVLDRSRGKFDKEKFLAYIKLPRSAAYVNPKYLERLEARQYPVDLNADFSAVTLLPVIGNDEPLVRSYLEHFFLEATGYKEYEPFINDVYLKHLFAETKILHGLGDPAQWYGLLPPEQYQLLKERIDIEFVPTNKTHFDGNEAVSLDVDIKNVDTLLVKVFEINTRNFYRRKQEEITTAINLDGLVANQELSFKYDEGPLRRVRRHFDFAALKRPGVYVVDFIGNGKSSRALVRKGRLNFVVQTTSAGHFFTILNEDSKPAPEASLWLGGQVYMPGKDGRIAVPFSTQPGPQKIVLCSGDFCSLAEFQHQEESYSLTAGIFVDREQLLSRRKSEVVIRPALRLGNTPVSLKLLEDVRLVITSVDLDGVSSSKEVGDFKLFEDRETTYEFLVPPRTAQISFQLKGKVQNVSRNQKQDVSTQESYSLNEIDRTDKIEDLHLSEFSGKYALFVLGKTGEAKPTRAVSLVIKHRDFRHPVHVTLQTDQRGRIELGELADIASVTATGPEGTSHTWPLPLDQNAYAQTVHGTSKQTIEIPYIGENEEPQRGEFSLLELRGGTFRDDQFEALKIEDGLVRIGPLPAGDYDLLYKPSGVHILIRVTDGEVQGGFAHGENRRLEIKNAHPVSIAETETTDDELKIRVANPGKYTRVHVIATRFVPAYRSFHLLSHVRGNEPALFGIPHAESMFLSGRNIGDEYRYILERRQAKKYPGNLLDRPALLLNPWAIRSTETTIQQAMQGEEFRELAEQNAPAPMEAPAPTAAPTQNADFSNLDFLAHTSVVIANVAVDKDGIVKIPRDALDGRQHLQVVAVDPESTFVRWLSLPEQKVDLLDLRLAKGLDPDSHFIQQKQVSLVPKGQDLIVPDMSGSRFEVYDSIARVYGLYATLSKDPKLLEFGFVTRWNKLTPEEKREKYSKYASHELSFFLMKKDPEFFREVIAPYLENKKDKTFLDHYLIESNVASYREPWQHDRLNIVERILIGRRIDQERPYVTREVEDRYSLLPPDLDRRTKLFQTAILGSALETESLGLEVEQRLVEAEDMPALGKVLSAGESMDFAPRPGASMAGAKREAGAAGGMAGRLDQARYARLRDAEKQVEALKKDSKAQAEADRHYFYDHDGVERLRRQEARQLFRQVDKTQEWAENNYYQLPIEQQNAELVTVNAFWRDFAKHDPAQPFYSQNMAEASRNFTEMMFALSVLDVPFEAGEHDTEFDGPKLKFAAASPAIVFHEEIKPAGEQDKASPVLVSQNFFQANDRHRIVENEQVDKYVTDEFLVNTVYGCQIVVTNPSSSRQKLDVLLQIPVGALPVANGLPTRSIAIDLQPFATHRLEYFFYFPSPGKYQHYPVHVSKNGRLTAFAEGVLLNVVAEPSSIDRESWEFVSQQGTDEQVLEYLRTRNLYRVNLERIAFRMADVKFFRQTIEILAARHAYNHVLWSYAVKHNAPSAVAEFLLHADDFVNQSGLYLKSPLLVIDPIARRTYQHLEYKPLVNARTHQLGKRRQIVNDRFFSQYVQTLALLSYRRTLSDQDLLAVTYYLLLQDRIEEGLDTFARVNADALDTRLQYDYFAAYLDMFSDEPKEAPAIVAKYANYPVDRWKNAFQAISAQLEEIAGEKSRVIDPEDRSQQISQLASTDPVIDFRIDDKEVVLDYRNLEKVTVNYYVMDIELLFSRNPFVQDFGEEFGLIRPNITQQLELKKDQRTTRFTIPKPLQTSNVLVEITGGGQTRVQAAFANVLSVQASENYAQVKVTDKESGKPLPKTYVKVYAQANDGTVKFYKDGYTDLRGRFDYGSVSTNELDNVKKFSLLVMSDDRGALIREVAPPQR